MNYINCIIKILEIPQIQSYSDNIKMGKFRVQLPYVRNKMQSVIIINSHVWGDLAYDIINYYKVNDYALVEGYLLTSSDNTDNNGVITINITKLYPFLFALESNKSN